MSERRDDELIQVQQGLVEQIEGAKKHGLQRQVDEATTQLRRVSLELLERTGNVKDIPEQVGAQVRGQYVFELMAITHLDAYGVTQGHAQWEEKVQKFGNAMREAASTPSGE